MSTVARRLVTAGLLVVAFAALVAGFNRTQTGERSLRQVNAAVERLVPGPDDIVRRQEQVGVDLAAGFDGVLQIDGVEIPEDQVTGDPALGQVFFQAGEGREIPEFEPGQHCVTAVYWPVERSREEASQSTSWCFRMS